MVIIITFVNYCYYYTVFCDILNLLSVFDTESALDTVV